MKRAAFTLIELLVVVAIVGLLAALLFPVLGIARDRARQTQCTSNMRQIGAGLSVYIADWDGALTPGDYIDARKIQVTWKDAIFPYIGANSDIFLCPGNPVGWNGAVDFWGTILLKSFPMMSDYRGDETQRYPISYGVNSYYFSPLNNSPVLLDDVREPSEILAIGESRWSDDLDAQFGPTIFWNSPNDPLSKGQFSRHGNRINFLFFDGHVKALRAIDTLMPKLMWGSNDRLKILTEFYPTVPIDPVKPDDPLVKTILSEYR